MADEQAAEAAVRVDYVAGGAVAVANRATSALGIIGVGDAVRTGELVAGVVCEIEVAGVLADRAIGHVAVSDLVIRHLALRSASFIKTRGNEPKSTKNARKTHGVKVSQKTLSG